MDKENILEKSSNEKFMEFLMFKSLDIFESEPKEKETTKNLYMEFLIPKGLNIIKRE